MKVALALPPKQKLRPDYKDRVLQCGIGYIAGGLKRGNLDITIYNSKYEHIYEDGLTNILLNGKYDIIGFSAMTFEIQSVGRISQRIKSAKQDCLIVIGGSHVNAIPKETMEEFPSFDLAFIGEHEDQVLKIFNLLYDRDYNSLEKIDSIIFRKDNELYYKNLNRRFIKDINKIAWPAYELFGNRNLIPAYFSMRGCPFECLFCQQNSGRAIRKRNPIDLCNEIEYFSKYFNQTRCILRDDSFGVDKEHAIAVCNEFIKRGLNKKFKWACTTHSKSADYQLYCLMREAGCYLVGIGIESGSDEVLKAIKKDTNLEIIKSAVNLARKAKMQVGGFFILGYPYETKRSMLKTIAFAVQLNLNYVAINMMTPFPGTKIYEYAIKKEAGLKLLTKDWEKYDNFYGYAMGWDNFSVTTLKIIQAISMAVFYLYNLRIREFVKLLGRYRKGIIAYILIIFEILGKVYCKTKR